MKSILLLSLLILSHSTFGQNEMYDICPIKNSQNIPDAIVYDGKGSEVNLKKYIGERPVILVFYRGGWCPYCTRHLSALNELKPQIDSLGYELIAITPDDFSKLDSSIVRSKGVGYQLFSDRDINAINSFGIGWKINDQLYKKYRDDYGMDIEWWTGTKNHVLPVPSVFIIKNGKIQFQHVDPDYSKRLSPEILLSLIKSE